MNLNTKTAPRLKELQKMLDNIGLWQGDSEDRINIEKRAIINFKNELKEIRDLDKTDCWKLWKFVDNLIQEIESVEKQ